MKTQTEPKTDIHQVITDRIVQSIEEGSAGNFR